MKNRLTLYRYLENIRQIILYRYPYSLHTRIDKILFDRFSSAGIYFEEDTDEIQTL